MVGRSRDPLLEKAYFTVKATFVYMIEYNLLFMFIFCLAVVYHLIITVLYNYCVGLFSCGSQGKKVSWHVRLTPGKVLSANCVNCCSFHLTDTWEDLKREWEVCGRKGLNPDGPSLRIFFCMWVCLKAYRGKFVLGFGWTYTQREVCVRFWVDLYTEGSLC